MLDNEPTGATQGDAAGTEQEHFTTERVTEATSRPRRAASRPAGPPPDPEDPPAFTPPAAPAFATQPSAPAATPAPSEAAPPAFAAAPASGGDGTSAAGSDAEASEEKPAPRRRATRARKTATVGADASALATAAAEASGTAAATGADAPSTDEEPQAAPARRRRSRAKTAEPEAAATDGTEATADGEAAAKAPRRTRRTRATADTAAETGRTDAGSADASGEAAEVPGVPGVPSVPAVPSAEGEDDAGVGPSFIAPVVMFRPPEPAAAAPVERPAADDAQRADADTSEDTEDLDTDDEDGDDEERGSGGRRRRRRGGRGRAKKQNGEGESDDDTPAEKADDAKGGRKSGKSGAQEAKSDKGGEKKPAEAASDDQDDDGDADGSSRRRRRRRRRAGSPESDSTAPDDPENTVVKIRPPRDSKIEDEVTSLRGSTRLEAKKQRRREGREQGRRRPPIITESEFLARRESVDRVMAVRSVGERTQIGVLEDGVLVEHYVDKSTQQSYVGNVYLGKVQNVLPSMEAAFVDIGKGRNAVLYAGEVNFDATGLEGQPKRIESALKSGQSVLVQVTKDPVGHKGARLTSQVSLPGRYLVYVPEGSMTGISRKLPDSERSRLKAILKKVMPEDAGVIVRTAAEGASEEELAGDIQRLAAQWEQIKKKAKTAQAPALLHGEPDMTVRVVRDIFNEDFKELIVEGGMWDTVDEYVNWVAPGLAERLRRWDGDRDLFEAYRIDEQIAKALERKVWLPSGGSLVIDRTEAMTVIDVNTGKFTGQGGNLEETVTKNNLEAAEEIVRQLRLRDVGGIIVIDFIDMVLEANRDLVLRRLLECLSRDRTKHQVAEVTSLGLVQMTRKRVGQGLLEAFSETCETCNGRGIIIHTEPVEQKPPRGVVPAEKSRKRRKGKQDEPAESPAAEQDADDSGADDEESTVEAVAEAAEAVSDIAAERAGASVDPVAESVNGSADKPKRRRTRRTKTEHAAVGE
ncbi:MAG TPA: Rne/Rng family ribonuclease [Streptosporangiaceae bacterium]|jgi:ribonuclease E